MRSGSCGPNRAVSIGPRSLLLAAAGAFLCPINSCVYPNACKARSQDNNNACLVGIDIAASPLYPARMAKKDGVSEYAALGGMARAKRLTAEQRKESARHAAATRWGSPPTLRATHSG